MSTNGNGAAATNGQARYQHDKVRVAIIGVGNCANSFVQGVYHYADADPNLIIAGYFVSDKLRQQNPDLVNRFVRATTKSMQYAEAHPDEVKQVLTTYVKITPDQAKAIVLPRYDATIDRAVMRHIADLVSKYKLADKAPDVDALIGQG